MASPGFAGTLVSADVHHRWMHRALLAMALLYAAAPAAAQHHCAATAQVQAKKLLELHIGQDDRIRIVPEVRRLAPIRNPANRRQSFDVLEVWAEVYKGQYRMRLIYAQTPGQCVLMGQELLEYASL